MPAHRMSMRKLKEVLRLKWVCGLSHRQISRAAGISVGAVSAYAARASAADLDWASVEPLADDELEARLSLPADQSTPARRIEPAYAVVHRELRRANVTLQLLWEEYVEAHPGERTYRYTQFCQRYKDWAQTLKRSMRQQHRAGEKLFADFAGHTMPILDGRGGLAFHAHVFVAVLGASNYTYACATRSEGTHDWIGGLIGAMEFYGGAPEKSPAGDFSGNQQVLVMRRNAAESAPLLAPGSWFLRITQRLKVNLAMQGDLRHVSIAAAYLSLKRVRDVLAQRVS
ncbi:hypothetical protein LMG22037_05888 [Paraburkholderia phenoliruptrix]|uniref:HTH IS408-type domain-containing protein n=1 Tax=Paraburkholderia phenoliruptrix TaxID=252970 RepID=A0A6J5CDR9_9BURK|nr:hypothetical protein LMG22037_05888 [Paraburkholderia phenoliruptrix]